MIRDGGGGRRRAHAKVMTSALCLLLISTLMAGCDLNNPTSPNNASQLTGQNTNQSFSFSGTITVSKSAGSVDADDVTTVTIIATVRDASGNPVPNLTTVTFSTDLGAFFVEEQTSGDAGTVRIVSPVFQATTFNGQAQAEFQSSGRIIGTARITASLGGVSGSTTVALEPAPVAGTIGLTFGASGEGDITATGSANQNAPLEKTVSVVAKDFDDNPIAGATVKFRIVEDTTEPNRPAVWVSSNTSSTGPDGIAANIVRVSGPGVVAMEADMIDPITGNLVATSNRIILTTTADEELTLAFANGATTYSANAAYSVGISALLRDYNGDVVAGKRVVFSIDSDTTTGATLSKTSVDTGQDGRAGVTLTVPSIGSVTVKAALLDADGSVIVSATVIATGT
jgi:hypothetical protein